TQTMRAADKSLQELHHRLFGAFGIAEVEHRCVCDDLLLGAADATPSLAHVTAPIPHSRARHDLSVLLENKIVAPAIDAVPPVERGISALLETPSPETFVEGLFQKINRVWTKQIGAGVSPIDQLNTGAKVLSARVPDGGLDRTGRSRRE